MLTKCAFNIIKVVILEWAILHGVYQFKIMCM